MTALPLDPDAVHRHFSLHGYVILEDAVDPVLLLKCDRLLRDHFGIPREGLSAANFAAAKCDVVSWGPVEEGVDAFVRLAGLPLLADATRAALGGPFDLVGSLVMYSAPNTIGQAWHQDCPCENPAHYNLNRLVYTHDIGDNGGEVVVVPGSHRRGIIPTGEPDGDIPGQLVIAPRAGTILLLHGMTWHRVLAVRDRPRVSCNFRVVPAGAPTTITDIGTYRNMRYRFSTREVVEERN